VLAIRRSAQSLALTVAVLSNACAAPAPKSPAADLPRYGAEDARLLDDSFSGHLFETAFVPGVAGDDPHFVERVQRAEKIWLIKVDTVSLEGRLEDQRRYDLSFRTLGSVLGTPPTEPVSLTISAKDPAFHWLDRDQGSWVGKEILLMVRNFRSRDDVVALHFHGEPNTPEVRARISQIRQAPSAAK
jgi:hypothetical protein